jgi:predicted deacylase
MPGLTIGGESISPGQRRTIDIRVARLHDFTEQSMTVEVLCGQTPGPTLLVTAAVHGDEIGGVEIIRRLLLAGERIGIVADPIGTSEEPVLAAHNGIVIGLRRLPLVSRGDALVHVATFENHSLEEFGEALLVPRSELPGASGG